FGTWALLSGEEGAESGEGSRLSGARPDAGPCQGDACTGRNSALGGTGCWMDAGTHAERVFGGRVVQLRVSPRCRAAWARLVEPRPGDEVRVESGDARQAQEATAGNRFTYTLMVGIDRPSDARACVELADGRSACTPWGEPGPIVVVPPPPSAPAG
ncbi:DUF2690 domain-containing protein, partial [Streptomyces sp. GC420]|uniref:DUF2690 domain-containing protein n=1 Tax=Streptomyces sp. GC420 TaxID=2697568 RepID=UPI001414D565